MNFAKKLHLLNRKINHKQVIKPLYPISLTVLAISLSACSGVPTNSDQNQVVAQPKLPLKQAYENFDTETITNKNQPSIAQKRWQDFYADENLKALIQLGLDNNKDFQNAILNIKKAQAQYQISRVQNIPSVNASGGVNEQGNFDGQSNTSYSVGLGLSGYEIDFWGKVANQKAQALENYLATTAGKDTVQIGLISNIAQAYTRLSYALARRELAEITLKSRSQSLFINQKRFEAGIDSKSPTLQAEASLEAAKIALYTAESEILQSRNALQLLIGSPVPDELLPKPAVHDIISTTIFSTGLPSELLRYRPDILQAEHILNASGANIKVARAAYFPSIKLSGQLGFASNSLQDLFKASAGTWSFALPSISVPIFNAGQLDANYEQAKIEQQQALNNYEKSIQVAFKEVSDLLAQRANLSFQIESQKKLNDNLNQTYQIAQARFKAGLSNYLEVLDAERSLFDNQRNILQLQQSQINSQIELYQVLGGGADLKNVPNDADIFLDNDTMEYGSVIKRNNKLRVESLPNKTKIDEADNEANKTDKNKEKDIKTDTTLTDTSSASVKDGNAKQDDVKNDDISHNTVKNANQNEEKVIKTNTILIDTSSISVKDDVKNDDLNHDTIENTNQNEEKVIKTNTILIDTSSISVKDDVKNDDLNHDTVESNDVKNSSIEQSDDKK